MGVFAPVRNFIETLVHPSANLDAVTAARHRAFIAPRLLGSVVAMALFPIYLVAGWTPGAIELIIFAWLVAPILTAYFLSRTGHYEGAHVLSAVALTALVAVVAAKTGGIASFAAIWLVVVPLEASLSASRRVVAIASSLALAAAGLLVLFGLLHRLPLPDPSGQAALVALGIVSASLYASGLALGAEALTRTGIWLLYTEEDRYRLLARDVTDVITRHGSDGAVVFVSPAAEMLLGCRIDDLRGQGLFQRVHVADRPAYLKTLGDTAALGESQSIEFRAKCEGRDADGRPAAQFAWIEMHCRPLKQTLREGVGQRREVVAVLRDISQRKRQEEALEQARAAAERANTAKSRFLATMSHELRTPLNAIIGFSEMLSNEEMLMLDGRRRREYAGLINDSGHHLLGVINGILDLSKIETGNFEITPEPFAPAQVITGCCDLLSLRAREAGVALEKAEGGDLPDIIADRRALQQILLNLLSNAIRFSDRGGKVTIGARAEAAIIVFVVEDNGVGISDDDLARLGEPYFQARTTYDRRHGSTGLGLSIVKGLVRLHGGEITIRSRVGEGTRVSVRLPLDCERAGLVQKQQKQPPVSAAVRPMIRGAGDPAGDPTSTAAREEIVKRRDIRVKKSA